MQLDLTSVLLSGLGAGGILLVGQYFISRHREREATKERFIAFMRGWESQTASGLGFRGSAVAQVFSDKLPLFAAEQVPMGKRYLSRANNERFRQLCERISKMAPGEVDSDKGNEELLARIQTLIAFVGRN